MRHAPDKSEGQQILHLVLNARGIPFSDETMFVMPQLVWPLELHIDEAVRRVPFDNLRRPADGKNPPAQGISDERSAPDWLRSHTQNAEMEPRRGQLLQVLRAREKIKHFIERSRDDLFGPEDEWWHIRKIKCPVWSRKARVREMRNSREIAP